MKKLSDLSTIKIKKLNFLRNVSLRKNIKITGLKQYFIKRDYPSCSKREAKRELAFHVSNIK